jgi:cytochrome c556
MKMFKMIAVLAGLSCLLGLTPVLSAEEYPGHENAKQGADAGANPLIEEMVKLDAVFREVVSGVALDDADRVRKAVESMHGSMEKTHQGVHRGTVKITKNADRIEDFVKLDRQFHADLEKLEAAAGKNDRTAMMRLTKKLLDQCVTCHRGFRNR